MARVVNSKGLSNKFNVEDSLDDFFKSLDMDSSDDDNDDNDDNQELTNSTTQSLPISSNIILDTTNNMLPVIDNVTILSDSNNTAIQTSNNIIPTSNEITLVQSQYELELKTEIKHDEDFVAASAKDMILELKDFIAAAKYLITTSPDPKSLESAANLFNSASTLLKEVSSISTLKRKEKANLAMEKLKQKHRLELQSAKINIQNMDVVNNTVNINTVSYSQENVIKKFKKT